MNILIKGSVMGKAGNSCFDEKLCAKILKLINTSPDFNTYENLAEIILETSGAVYVLANEFIYPDCTIVKASAGLDKTLQALSKLIPDKLTSTKFVFTNPAGVMELKKGEVVEIKPDFHSLSAGKITKKESKAIVASLQIESAFLLGIFSDDTMLGSFCIFTKSNISSSKKNQISEIANLLSVVLDKRKLFFELIKNESQFRAIFEKSKDAIALYKDDVFLLVNDAFARLCGYENKDEIVGMEILNFVSPSERDLIAKLSARRKRGEDVIDKYETIGIKKDRTEIEISVTVSTFTCENENYFFIILRDETRRNNTERALAESEERLRTLIDASPDSICFKDGEGRWLLANKAKLNIHGLQEIDYRGFTIDELAKKSRLNNFSEQAADTDRLAWEQKTLIRSEEKIKSPGGAVEIFDVLKQPLFNKDGSRKALVTLGRNITERIIAEEELKKHKENLEYLVDERTAELIKTINFLSVEVASRKSAERLIKLQNSLGNNLLSASSIKNVLELGAGTCSEIFKNNPIVAFISGKNNPRMALPSGVNEIDELLSSAEINSFFKLIWKEKIVLFENINFLPELFYQSLKKYGYEKVSLIPVSVKNKVVAVYLIFSKIQKEISESLFNTIEAISAQIGVAFGVIKSKKDLEESENKWHRLYENLPGGTFVVNDKFIIEDVNEIFCKICGFEKQDVIGKPCDLICPQGKGHCSLLHNGDIEHSNQETEVIKKDGTRVPIVKSICRIPVNDEKFVIENFQDISRQKNLEKKLSSINEVFLQFGPDSQLNINLLTKLLGELLNATCALYNCINNEMLCSIGMWNAPEDYNPVDKPEGHICYDVINSSSPNLFIVKNLLNSKYRDSDPNVKKYGLETYIGKAVKCNGEVIGSICVVFQADYTPTDDDLKVFGIIASALGVEEERRLASQQLESYKGKLEEMVKERTIELTKANQQLAKEITEKQITEHALERSEQEYKGLFENTHEAFVLFDCRTGKVLEVNGKATRLFNLERESFIHKNIDFVFDDKSTEIVEYMLEGKGVPQLNFELVKKTENGETLILDVNASNQTYHGCDVLLCTIRDIAERKQALKELEESRQLYKQLVQNATDIIMRFDERGRINFVNSIGENKMGFNVDNIIGKYFIEFVDKEYKEKVFHFYEHQIKNNIPNTYFEIPIISGKGAIIWLGQNVQLILKDGKVSGMQAVARDITQRKYAEDALRESESRFRVMAESISNVAIYGFDADKKIIFWNSACEYLYGYKAEVALGEKVTDLIISKPEINKFCNNFNNSLMNNTKWPLVENENRRKDGSIISVISNKVKLITGSGRVEFYALDIDLTERKEAERALQKAKRIAEEANRAKSDFLTNISHELRTPLNGILGYAQTLKNDIQLGDRQREGINVIEKSGNHLLTLIEDILDLSKIESKKLKLNPQKFNFIDFLNNTAALFRLRAEQKWLTFKFLPDNNLPKIVVADEKYLGQVLFNLLSNAIKFTESGSIIFKAEVKGKKIRFAVVDTGIGIPDDQINEIFSPFSQGLSGTVKNEGTGLGLTISKRLVKMMGGQLKVESTPEKGSEFWFELALIEKEIKLPVKGLDDFNIIGFKGDKKLSILVVDDDFANRRLLKNVFSEIGLDVIEAEDGKQGLLKTIEEKPDLILMDIMMPEIDGLTITKSIREKVSDENLVIIALTASSSEKVKREALKAGCNDFVTKPIIFDKLFKTISKFFNIEWIRENNSGAFKTVSNQTVIKHKFDISAETLEALIKVTNDGDISQMKKILDSIGNDEHSKYFKDKVKTYIQEFQINNLRKFLQSIEKE